MNTRLFAAALVASATLISASAFAEGTQTAYNGDSVTVAQAAPDGLTRAQVRDELRQARASGQLDQSLQTYPSLLQQRNSAGLSRAQVRSQIGEAATLGDNRA